MLNLKALKISSELLRFFVSFVRRSAAHADRAFHFFSALEVRSLL
jgi:hypothetical protein